MKKLNYVNQVIAVIFNSINLVKISIVVLAEVGAHYYSAGSIDASILKHCDSIAIKWTILFCILSLIYITLNYIFNKKDIEKGLLSLTIIGCILTILSLFVPLY